jgi:NAD(P)-dependent dehydrogenase (short-subunit alcohol dehydrogenase family)
MGWLDKQVALVTGGGSGIGRAVVARFVAEGARVGVMDRVASRTEALRAEFGAAVVGIQGDVARLDDNKRAVAETVRAFGRLDIFVGNAGVFDGNARLDELPEDRLEAAFDEQFAVNVKALVFGVRAALSELANNGGAIVFTASVAGFNSGGGGALYTASKHAVVGLIRQGPAIRVNGVAPGGTMTDLRGLGALGREGHSHFADPGTEERLRNNPLRMALQPDDLAGAYLFLASGANAGGITGTVVRVDAGSMLRMPRPRA